MNKVLIIGTGSIAKKHAINLHSLKYKIYIFSASKNKIILNNKKININYIYNLDNLKDFKFAVLANDTNKHLSILTILIKKKINVYCEKPITNKKFDYANIRKKIIQNKILIFTGYQLLQHEKIQYLKKIISKEKILSFNLEVGHDYKKWRKGTLKKIAIF